LAESLRGQPLAEGYFRRLLGRTYQMHGKVEQAAEQLEAGVRLYESHAEPDALETLLARSDLAAARNLLRERERPLAELQVVAPALAERLGRDHPHAIQATLRLGTALRNAGRVEDSITLLTAETDRLRTIHGESEVVLRAERVLAGSYSAAFRYADAVALQSRIVAGSERGNGREHSITVADTLALAIALTDAHRPAEAIPLFTQTIPSLQKRLGVNHPAVIQAKSALGGAYAMTGQFGKAIPLLEEAHRHAAQSRGPEDLLTLDLGFALARASNQAGGLWNCLVALIYQERSVPILQKRLGPTDRASLFALMDLTNTYASINPNGSARKTSARELARHAQDAANVEALRVAVIHLIECNAPAEAEARARALLPLCERAGGGWHTGRARGVLGFTLCRQGKFNEAEPILLAAYEELRSDERSAHDPERPIFLVARCLCWLYDERKQPTASAEWARRANAAR
jgi:tetratricopeptide (TPR) repeat protein